jgi:hypothetical protein
MTTITRKISQSPKPGMLWVPLLSTMSWMMWRSRVILVWTLHTPLWALLDTMHNSLDRRDGNPPLDCEIDWFSQLKHIAQQTRATLGTTESRSVADGQQGFHLAHQWDGFWSGSICVMVAAKDLVHYIFSLVGFKGEWLQLSELWSIELWRGFAMGFQTKCATRGLLLYIG